MTYCKTGIMSVEQQYPLKLEMYENTDECLSMQAIDAFCILLQMWRL